MKQPIYLLMLCCFPLWVQAETPATIDSLQRKLQTLPHDTTRLKMIQDVLRVEQANSQCIPLSKLLFQEATEQNDDHYAGVAVYFQIIYYYNQNQLDSVSKRLTAMEPYARKAKLWDYYFDGMRCEIDLISYREQYELAINKSFKMSQKAKATNSIRGEIAAYQCLSNAYLGTGRTKEAKESLQKAYQLLPQLDNVVVQNSVLTQIIALSHKMSDYTDLIKFLRQQKQLLSEFISANPDMKAAFCDPYIFNEIYQSYYHSSTKQPESALKHLITARKYLKPETYFTYKILYQDAYADYYRLKKEYDRALQCIDSTIVKLKDVLCSDYITQLEKKADILVEAGRKKEALVLYQQVFHSKDSLERILSAKQMQLIQNDYNIDKLRLEKEQLRNKIQLTMLVVILIAIIALLLFTVRIIYIQKALKRSEQETREATLAAEKANETKNRFLSNMSYNIRIPLNGVVGFSQLIAIDPHMEESTRKEYSTIVQKNSEELMRLVNDVLDLSRLEADMMKFQLQQYDILLICKEVLYTAKEVNKGQIEIDFRQQIETGSTATVDANRFSQALLTTLTYPEPRDEKRNILFTLSLNAEGTSVRICINNSPLADPEFQSQEVAIRHDINRLLLKHFGGTYTVTPDALEGPTIVFTYPLSVSE